MEYRIIGTTSGAQSVVPLSRAEFERYRQAKLQIDVLLAIEEKYALLLANYAELEQCMLELCLRWSLYNEREWADTVAAIFEISRRLANTLSAARLYIDQVPQDLKAFAGGSILVEQFRSFVAAESAKRLGYRFMEELRNHIQHRGLPVDSLSYGWRLEERPGTVKVNVFYVEPQVNLDSLREDKRFSRAVLKEYEDLEPRVTLKHLVRDYIEGMSSVHRGVRGSLETPQQEAFTLCGEVRQRLQPDVVQKVGGLAVQSLDDSGVNEDHHVFDDIVERIRWHQRVNSRQGMLLGTEITSR